ncbi:hypothetical protein V5O48_002988 [Marasmius crinis-equi]|uniref:Thiaminase-2/PQQC domain-containing protein n=1 Tax=Marasmius crinis-equi TaxID=585013 RepID=A0ABR3FU57_9AGAR
MESQKLSLTSHLLNSSTKLPYDAAIKHDFLTAAGSGTLDHNLLALWLSQDKTYATQGYPRFIGSLVANMAYNKPRMKDMSEEDSYYRTLKTLIFCMENIGLEIDFFRTTAEKWDLDLEGWKERQGTKDYLAEMDKVVRDYGPGIEHGLVFLWAMERVYLDAWTYVKNRLQTSNLSPDQSLTIAATSSFATNWSNKDFVAFVDRLADIVDSLDIAPDSPTWKDCEEIWSRVVELEVYFWPKSGEEKTRRG